MGATPGNEDGRPSLLEASALRSRAEGVLAQRGPRGGSDGSAQDLHEQLHELRVYQIELELQQEALRQALAEIEQARARLAELYDFAPVAYLTLDDQQRIRECNLAASQLLGSDRSELNGVPFWRFVVANSAAGFQDFLEMLSASPSRKRVECGLVTTDARHLVVCIEGQADAATAGFRVVLDDVTAKRANERERTEQSLRLQELSRRLLTVQELERRRLSAELHDRTSPNLAAIQLSLKALAAALPPSIPREVDALLADMAALLQDTGASIRDICADLRPPVLDHAGLVPALESYARQIGRRSGVAVSVDAGEWAGCLSAEHESVLFRIVQEGLVNCARHAQATKMEIVLADCGSQTVLTIADDGIGFVPKTVARGPAAGQGLLTMRERAEFAGASFEIDSRPGAGTRITVRIGSPSERHPSEAATHHSTSFARETPAR